MVPRRSTHHSRCRAPDIVCGNTDAGLGRAADRGGDAEHPIEHRIRDGVARRSVGGDAAVVEHHDMLGIERREIEVVQHRDHGHAAAGTAAERCEHVDLMAQVEARGRLVEQEQARAMRLLPARELHQDAMVRRASPFPAPPGGRGMSFTVPVSFRIQ
jgi:hypothetical protein